MSRPITPVPVAPAAGTGTLSRSNSQRVGHAGSRPVSHVGGDTSGVEVIDHSSGAYQDTSMLSQSAGSHPDNTFNDAASTRSGLQRSNSQMSQSATAVPSRGGTLKKKASLKATGSLKRTGSKRSSYAGSVRSTRLGEKEKYEPTEEHNSAFYCPVPTHGSPTDLLADRFQSWRKVLKDLINYFREVQKSYEARSKTIQSVSNGISNMSMPPNFMGSGGLADAAVILRDFHKVVLNENNKSKELEHEVIEQLTGLRSDLQQKIKEIKSLSGDFKNSVGKEQEGTKKAIRALQDSLGHVDHDASSTSGKNDPFLVKMGVDRQLERQIEEENYLHRAYLNLEASGRELESIVVGEIQKAYHVMAGIMKREADHSYEASEKLREGPIAMPKDLEWDRFVTNNDHMVDPRVPVRQFAHITYDGKNHLAAIEVKSGMLERKSKYLKSYTPGWYVLSPTHLHEFKSADRIASQSPVMSLYLPEQKLGTHSEPGSSSHKFILKGRQTGGMHRGHSWIFRAETHDTMLAWFGDIKELTEKRGEERNDFVRRTHARTLSSSSMKAPSIVSTGSGLEEDDEADQVPFSGEQSIRGLSVAENASGVGATNAYDGMDDNRSESGWRPQRPTPGGRFPSDLNVQRGLQAPLSPSSGDSLDETDRDTIAAAGALPGSDLPYVSQGAPASRTDLQRSVEPERITQQSQPQQGYFHHAGNEVPEAAEGTNNNAGINSYTVGDHRRVAPTTEGAVPVETASTYGEWMAPISAGAGSAALGAAGAHAYDQHRQSEHIDDQQYAIPAAGHSSAPMMVASAPPPDAPTEPRSMREPTEDLTATRDTPSYVEDTRATRESSAFPQNLIATRDNPSYTRENTATQGMPAYTQDRTADRDVSAYTQDASSTRDMPVYPQDTSSTRDMPMHTQGNSAATGIAAYAQNSMPTQETPTYKQDTTATREAPAYLQDTSSPRDILSHPHDTSLPHGVPTDAQGTSTASDVPWYLQNSTRTIETPAHVQDTPASTSVYSSVYATSTMPPSAGIGTNAPAPSQTLYATEVEPNTTRAQLHRSPQAASQPRTT